MRFWDTRTRFGTFFAVGMRAVIAGVTVVIAAVETEVFVAVASTTLDVAVTGGVVVVSTTNADVIGGVETTGDDVAGVDDTEISVSSVALDSSITRSSSELLRNKSSSNRSTYNVYESDVSSDLLSSFDVLFFASRTTLSSLAFAHKLVVNSGFTGSLDFVGSSHSNSTSGFT